MKQTRQIRLIGFICKAEDLTKELNEQWEKLEKMKDDQEKKKPA